jgi:hypothetical protein
MQRAMTQDLLTLLTVCTVSFGRIGSVRYCLIDATFRQWRTRLRACGTAKGGYFEH